MNFDIKPVMTYEEKIAEDQLVGSLIAEQKKMVFSG